MKHFILIAVFLALAVTGARAQQTARFDVMARKALDRLATTEPVPFERTAHPNSQWFPDATFGLFIHWGIHSVAGIEPSWTMMKGCPWQHDFYGVLGWDKYLGKENYYKLLYEFDPQNYEPDKWIKAAASSGMKYAVITTKHHDGYALWPSDYGELSTKQYMGGRDLLRPFVDACRKYGLKVGFYFSPRDWGYPGYPQSMTYGERYVFPEGWNEDKNREAFDRFYDYTVGQLSEILTRYGKIDVLWFDGMGWTNIRDIRTEQTLAWIRSLQPSIVINNRWGGAGDFVTPEGHLPADAPAEWWENCVSWSGHWGYSPHTPFMPGAWVMNKLVRARAGGGNLLLNIGPAGDGSMRPGYYEGFGHIAAWMDVCGESLIGAKPVRTWEQFSNVPVTRREGVWFLHVLPLHEGSAIVKDVPKPREVKLLNHDVELTLLHKYDEETRNLTANVPMTIRSDLNNVIAVYWDHEPDR